MEISYATKAIEDINFWKKQCKKVAQKKIEALLKNIIDTPFEGIGQPEPLKYNLSGAWSRRINQEHRLIYEVHEEEIQILSLRGHY